MGGKWTAVLVAAAAVIAATPAHGATERDLAGGALFGAQIDPVTAPAFCDRLREDGSHAVSVFLSRGVIERNDGTLNTAAIDNRIEPDRACGLAVGVRVKPTSDPDQKSFLPAGAELESYLGLLTQLARHLDGRVASYAIDNEAASQAHFDGTADEYFELLRQSAAALRAGDPDARILDGTMASGNTTAVMVTDLYDQGRYGEAISLAQETQANELGGGAPVTDMASLTAYVTNARVVRSVAFFAGLVANQASLDAFQLHYYGPWRGQIEMIDFVRSHGITLPIETWEVAHRYRDGRPFTEEDFAAETARLLIGSAGEGSAFTIFSSYLGNPDNDAVGLFATDATTPHLARDAFRMVNAQLTGATSAERLPLGGDAFGYRFERPVGGPIAAAWADPHPSRAGGDLAIDASTALITPVVGDRRARSPRQARGRADARLRGAGPARSGSRRQAVQEEGQAPGQLSRRVAGGELRRRGEGHAGVQQEGGGGRRKADKREQALGKARFRVVRGETEKLKVRFDERGVAGQAIATTKRCTVRGKGGCRSWTDLR